MLLNKEEIVGVVGEWIDSPGDRFGLVDMILAAERAKAAPHFDALPMMDSRELFMAGAEWGNRMAQAGARMVDHKTDWIKAPGTDDRRAELLELAGGYGKEAFRVALTNQSAIERFSAMDSAGLARAFQILARDSTAMAAAIIDAVDKEVAK